MSLAPLHSSSRVPSSAALAALQAAITSFRISSKHIDTSGRRNASHQAQGRANGPKDTAGRRLGAKKADGQYVVPGNILFKQRGTLWFPGDGCFMGRDHTIHASVPGYVKYYRDPGLHVKRKYIGVVFERDNVLPQPHNAVRRRKLGMLAYQMPTAAPVDSADQTNESTDGVSTYTPSQAPLQAGDAPAGPTLRMRAPEERQKRTVRVKRKAGWVDINLYKGTHHEWRQSAWEIGRAGERNKNWQKEMSLTRGQKFAALQARNANRPTRAQQKAMKKGGKQAKKAKKSK